MERIKVVHDPLVVAFDHMGKIPLIVLEAIMMVLSVPNQNVAKMYEQFLSPSTLYFQYNITPERIS